MKLKNYIIGSISALAGILLVILLLVNVILVQESFLNYTNHKYTVEKNLSMSEEDLKAAVHGMISYVKGKNESPQVMVEIKGNTVEFFNEQEIGHLYDVRVLIRNIYICMVVMLLICMAGEGYLIYKKAYYAIRKGILFAWGILLLLSVIIGILAIIDIRIVITGFHQLFLSDSKWVLNPALDRSVWMFRTYMYKDVILALAGIIGATVILTLLPLIRVRKKR